MEPVLSTTARIVRKGCAQLFIVCAATGDTGKNSVPVGFLKRAGIFGRNLILLRDPHRTDFERGVSDDIADLATLVGWLRAERAQMPHVRDVYCFGYSSGAYAALVLGHLLCVKAVIAFSPRSARGGEEAKRSLTERLSEHNGVTAYRVCYSPLNTFDNAFAERLRGCPGLSLDPRPLFGLRHDIVVAMGERGELSRELPPFEEAAPEVAPETT